MVVVYAALGGNLLIAITKFIAASFTGSSAMLSEGVHSLVDTGNELLLLYGIHRAKRPPDEGHPFGHGRELYFWSFIVALLLFALGAGVSTYEGVVHILTPEKIESPLWNYVVLGLSILFEGTSWAIALREFNRERGHRGFIEAIRRSKDPTTFTVLVEDTVALVGLVIALAGIAAAQVLDMPELDGVASIGIGLLLAATAVFLARESKGLLIGEQALPEINRKIRELASAQPEIHRVNGLMTSQLGPGQVLAALSAEFDDHLTTIQIEACIARLEKALAAASPDVLTIFVKPQTPEHFEQNADALRQRDRRDEGEAAPDA